MGTRGSAEVAGVESFLHWGESDEENKLLFWREKPRQDSVVPSLETERGREGEGEGEREGERERLDRERGTQ